MTTDVSSINYEIDSLVWLDPEANNTPEFIILQEKLRNIINYLKIFENIESCEQYIQSVSNYDRIILLINSRFASDLIPRIHSIKQISSIYIYDQDKEPNEQWIKQYPKVKYIVMSSDELLTAIQSDQQQTFAFSIYQTPIQSSPFLYFQLIIDCLLRMEINLPTQTQLLSFCREIYHHNPTQLNFLHDYSSHQALEWYKQKSCFSKIVNKALCIQDINTLFFFRFFLRDIQKQLEKNPYPSSIRFYRNQCISNDELELIKNSMGELISINSFFEMKLTADDWIIPPGDLQRVLFEIDLDPELKSFSVLNPSEMLIMPGTIFRLIDIHFDEKQFWIIRMKLSKENFQSIFDFMKNKVGYHDDKPIDLITLGNILWKMEKLNDAKRYYLYLLDLLPADHVDRANCYFNLGHIYSDENDDKSSLKSYHQSLEIWLKTIDANLANNYNAIATIHWKKGDYKQASQSFHQALDIFQQIYGENHITIAMCLNNIGTVMSNEKNDKKALDYYLKALNLFQKSLPNNHPNLASLHCNISTIYKNLHQMEFALEHLNASLKIYEQSFPFNHPNILMMLKNIAFLYEQKGDFQQAIMCYEKISSIYQQTGTSTDPMVLENEEKIQLLRSKHPI